MPVRDMAQLHRLDQTLVDLVVKKIMHVQKVERFWAILHLVDIASVGGADAILLRVGTSQLVLVRLARDPIDVTAASLRSFRAQLALLIGTRIFSSSFHASVMLHGSMARLPLVCPASSLPPDVTSLTRTREVRDICTAKPLLYHQRRLNYYPALELCVPLRRVLQA